MLRSICAGVVIGLLALPAAAVDKPPVYLDTSRSFQDRAADLVSRMTLDEKISQMQNDAVAIPRLNVPAYEWWNEALHGVARGGLATVFPQAKHYAVHSGPEPERHHFDVHPTEEDLYETYLPAFRALVQEGHVSSVMGAYNRVNGVSASASPRLLHDILRQDWGFKGYIVSDCDSVDDIYKQHKSARSPEEGAAMALRAGMTTT